MPGRKRLTILWVERAPMGLNFFSKNNLAVIYRLNGNEALR